MTELSGVHEIRYRRRAARLDDEIVDAVPSVLRVIQRTESEHQPAPTPTRRPAGDPHKGSQPGVGVRT